MLLIAFLVVGPKDLPKVARWLGRQVNQMKRLLKEVKQETGWDDLEKEFRDTKADVNQTIKSVKDDLDVSSDLKSASDELNRNVRDVKADLTQAEKEIRENTEKK